MKLSRMGLRRLIESVLREENSDAKVVVEKANGLEYCASKVKKYVQGKDSSKKEVSLGELNEMLDFYKNDSTNIVKVVEKGHPEISGFKKFELSAEEGHHNSLNYHPFGMTVPPKIVE